MRNLPPGSVPAPSAPPY